MATVQFLMPIRASLLTAVLAEVLHGLFMCSVGASNSSRICLQSLKSCLCGGNRWLPLLAFGERRQGQVPLYIYNESPTLMPRIVGVR